MTDPHPPPAVFANPFLTTIADPACIQWSENESDGEGSNQNENTGIMQFVFPALEPTGNEAETLRQLKNAQRPIIFAVIDDAFFHGVNIRLAKRGAALLLPGSAEWLKSGRAIQHTVDRLAAIDMEVDRNTAHIIASSLVFFNALQDGTGHRWMVGEILGQLSRSDMVDNREGILGNWRWLKKPEEARATGRNQSVRLR